MPSVGNRSLPGIEGVANNWPKGIDPSSDATPLNLDSRIKSVCSKTPIQTSKSLTTDGGHVRDLGIGYRMVPS